NDGDNWRADAPTSTTGGGPGGGGGPQWGDGTAALNYNGALASNYNTYYTLKSQGIDEPWQHLINTCDILENTPIASLAEELPAVLDVDRALWFLACEIAFGDDDSYVYKGKMDYYAYWELETGRMTPLEYDGNSVLGSQANSWGPFYHADNANYPLINRLMQVPAYRQRYLAHLRTILDESINLSQTQAFINEWGAFIDALVESDPKKLTTYAQFNSEKTVLQQRLTARRNALVANTEVNTTGAIISEVKLYTNDVEWQLPEQNQAPLVKATITSTDPIASVNLYYATGLVGNFSSTPMTFNGTQYVAELPMQAAGTVIRFYVEAVEGNMAGTRSYNPAGAEHDFYYYFILPSNAAQQGVVINEIMASNGGVAVDEVGESDDWIELYNPTAEAIDLTGFYLTDNQWNLTKWEIPTGTIINPDSYLIVWADEDGTQGNYHANFKLSAEGETVYLMNNIGEIADAVTYQQQQQSMGYARNPNGTGPFVIQMQTFNANNTLNVSVNENEVQATAEAFPNPFRGNLTISYNQISADDASIELLDLSGRSVFLENGRTLNGSGSITLETSDLATGSYILKIRTSERLITKHLIKN
ncbi:MAG: CotH kinase family protein, partial [Flavobacteriales bacterium]